jgi:hypothetical protein
MSMLLLIALFSALVPAQTLVFSLLLLIFILFSSFSFFLLLPLPTPEMFISLTYSVFSVLIILPDLLKYYSPFSLPFIFHILMLLLIALFNAPVPAQTLVFLLFHLIFLIFLLVFFFLLLPLPTAELFIPLTYSVSTVLHIFPDLLIPPHKVLTYIEY